MIKRILIGIVSLIVILVAVSQLLTGDVHVERRITINAPPQAIFPMLNSLKNTEKWSPWLEREPKAELKYDGPPAGVDAKLTWRNDVLEVGGGKDFRPRRRHGGRPPFEECLPRPADARYAALLPRRAIH